MTRTEFIKKYCKAAGGNPDLCNCHHLRPDVDELIATELAGDQARSKQLEELKRENAQLQRDAVETAHARLAQANTIAELQAVVGRYRSFMGALVEEGLVT